MKILKILFYTVIALMVIGMLSEGEKTDGAATENPKAQVSGNDVPAPPEANLLPYTVLFEKQFKNEHGRSVVEATIALSESESSIDRASLAATCMAASRYLLAENKTDAAVLKLVDRRASHSFYELAHCSYAEDGRGLGGSDKWTWSGVAAADRTTTADEKAVYELWNNLKIDHLNKKTLKVDEAALTRAVAKKLKKKPEEIALPDLELHDMGDVKSLAKGVKGYGPLPVDPMDKLPDMESQKMSKKGFPKLYASLGAKRMEAVNAMLPEAALRAAESNTCDFVSTAGYSTSRSTKKNAVFYIDCVNEERFYVSEADLKNPNPAPAQSVREKILKTDAVDYWIHCEKQIKARLQFPSTYDEDFLGKTDMFTGRAFIVQVKFEAKNGLGNTLPMLGRCEYNDQGLVDVTIVNR